MRFLSAIVLALAAAPLAAQPAVTRAQFTSGITDREPVDALDTMSVGDGRVRFFTELHGLAGERVIHRWEYGGRVMAEVPIDVGADRWRAWSSKRVLPAWTGEWQVSVVLGDGSVIGSWPLRVE